MTEIAAQSKSRMVSGAWLAIGVIMAVMYTINGIQASSIGYLFSAAGWALLGAAQWWRSRPVTGASAEVESVRRRTQIARYLVLVAFLLIVGGVAARWS